MLELYEVGLIRLYSILFCSKGEKKKLYRQAFSMMHIHRYISCKCDLRTRISYESTFQFKVSMLTIHYYRFNSRNYLCFFHHLLHKASQYWKYIVMFFNLEYFIILNAHSHDPFHFSLMLNAKFVLLFIMSDYMVAFFPKIFCFFPTRLFLSMASKRKWVALCFDFPTKWKQKNSKNNFRFGELQLSKDRKPLSYSIIYSLVFASPDKFPNEQKKTPNTISTLEMMEVIGIPIPKRIESLLCQFLFMEFFFHFNFDKVNSQIQQTKQSTILT